MLQAGCKYSQRCDTLFTDRLELGRSICLLSWPGRCRPPVCLPGPIRRLRNFLPWRVGLFQRRVISSAGTPIRSDPAFCRNHKLLRRLGNAWAQVDVVVHSSHIVTRVTGTRVTPAAEGPGVAQQTSDTACVARVTAWAVSAAFSNVLVSPVSSTFCLVCTECSPRAKRCTATVSSTSSNFAEVVSLQTRISFWRR